MTDAADLTHAVLLKVADFIRRLPAEQLRDLADGTAKLELVGKAGRVAPGSRTAAPKRAAAPKTAAALVAPEQVRADLAAIGDLATARQYLVDLRLTIAQLRSLGKELGIAMPSSVRKESALQTIVQWTVGRRLDSESISRPAAAVRA